MTIFLLKHMENMYQTSKKRSILYKLLVKHKKILIEQCKFYTQNHIKHDQQN